MTLSSRWLLVLLVSSACSTGTTLSPSDTDAATDMPSAQSDLGEIPLLDASPNVDMATTARDATVDLAPDATIDASSRDANVLDASLRDASAADANSPDAAPDAAPEAAPPETLSYYALFPVFDADVEADGTVHVIYYAADEAEPSSYLLAHLMHATISPDGTTEREPIELSWGSFSSDRVINFTNIHAVDVDADGKVSAFLTADQYTGVGSSRERAVFYVTNASGAWISSRVLTLQSPDESAPYETPRVESAAFLASGTPCVLYSTVMYSIWGSTTPKFSLHMSCRDGSWHSETIIDEGSARIYRARIWQQSSGELGVFVSAGDETIFPYYSRRLGADSWSPITRITGPTDVGGYDGFGAFMTPWATEARADTPVSTWELRSTVYYYGTAISHDGTAFTTHRTNDLDAYSSIANVPAAGFVSADVTDYAYWLEEDAEDDSTHFTLYWNVEGGADERITATAVTAPPNRVRVFRAAGHRIAVSLVRPAADPPAPTQIHVIRL